MGPQGAAPLEDRDVHLQGGVPLHVLGGPGALDVIIPFRVDGGEELGSGDPKFLAGDLKRLLGGLHIRPGVRLG